MHYKRIWKHGSVATRTMRGASIADRLASRTAESGGCLIWTGSKNAKGYGQMRVGETMRKVHRVAYELVHGPIPEGMQIDHKCHNRACVRVAHLHVVSNKENQENLSGPYSNNTSGSRGVAWFEPRNKWVAYVNHNGKRYHLGYFTSATDADRAAIAKRNELFINNPLDRLG